MRRWRVIVWAVATLGVAVAIGVTRLPDVADAGEPTAAATPPENPFALSTDEFFAHPAVRLPLEPASIDDAMLRAAVFHQTNRIRAEHDLPPLRHDARLSRAADEHAAYLVEHRTLTHENTHDPDRRWPMDRVLPTGYVPREVSENVAQTFRERYQPPRPYYKVRRNGRVHFSYEPRGEPIPPHTYLSFAQFMVSEWMASPGHRANILRPSSEDLGVAVRLVPRDEDLDEAYGVQVFAAPLRR
jgi:uncharacterized protein YkwD